MVDVDVLEVEPPLVVVVDPPEVLLLEVVVEPPEVVVEPPEVVVEPPDVELVEELELDPPLLAPPELEPLPPELAPPELAPPELAPPELAPPELPPPELDPPPPRGAYGLSYVAQSATGSGADGSRWKIPLKSRSERTVNEAIDLITGEPTNLAETIG